MRKLTAYSRRACVVAAPLFILASALLIAACGGGGGASSTPDASPTPAFDLQLIAQSCDSDAASGQVIVTGTARIVSNVDLAGAIARATFSNDQGTQVGEAEAPLPAVSSGLINFRVAAANSPDITRCIVRFNTAQGEAVRVDYTSVQVAPDAGTASPAAPTPAAAPTSATAASAPIQ